MGKSLTNLTPTRDAEYPCIGRIHLDGSEQGAITANPKHAFVNVILIVFGLTNQTLLGGV